MGAHSTPTRRTWLIWLYVLGICRAMMLPLRTGEAEKWHASTSAGGGSQNTPSKAYAQPGWIRHLSVVRQERSTSEFHRISFLFELLGRPSFTAKYSTGCHVHTVSFRIPCYLGWCLWNWMGGKDSSMPLREKCGKNRSVCYEQ